MIGYKAAVQWLIYNDDCHWLDDEYGSISVCAAMVCDVYGKTEEKVTSDLRKLWKEFKNENAS